MDKDKINLFDNLMSFFLSWMLNVNFTVNKNPSYQSIQLYYQPYEVTWALPALQNENIMSQSAF